MFKPTARYFKPRGVPLRNLEEVELKKDELEAIRLRDYYKLDRETAVKQMATTQSTFYRILSSGRQKVIKAIVEGKAIKIEE